MNPDKYENKGKILKVIYYDENAAMDYVTIMNDGNITIEEINKAIEGKDNEIGVNGEASIKTSFLKMLNLLVGVKSDVAAHSSNEKIVNSTITTNIMTEFIKLADKDDNIEKLMDLKLDIDQDTATYLKSMFPYLSFYILRFFLFFVFNILLTSLIVLSLLYTLASVSKTLVVYLNS